MKHADFEAAVMQMLLAGDHPELGKLRRQYEQSKVRRRDWTGSGVFVYFEVPDNVQRTKLNEFHLGDIYIILTGYNTPADAIVFVKSGKLDFLECFVYDGQWPRTPEIEKISYYGNGNRDPGYLSHVFAM